MGGQAVPDRVRRAPLEAMCVPLSNCKACNVMYSVSQHACTIPFCKHPWSSVLLCLSAGSHWSPGLDWSDSHISLAMTHVLLDRVADRHVS